MSKWEWKKLKDICEIEFGTRVVRKKDGGSIYPVYGGGGATFKMDSFNREDCLIVSRFAMSPQCTRIVKGKFFLNDSGLSLKSKDLSVLSEQYLNSIILGINDDIYALGRGAAQRNLNVEAFKELNIPIPPLSEQKRIVKFLDEEFSKIDTLKTNAETNLKNAKELFESELRKTFGNPIWKKKNFSDLFKLKSGEYLNSKDISEGEYPVYGGNGIIAFHNKYNLNGANVIIGRVGALCGNVRFISDPIWLTDNAFRIVFQTDEIDCLFATYLLNFLNLRSYARQAAQPVISNASLKDVSIPLPPLSVQKEIVARLDKLSENVKRLEANYKQIIANCDELKKSILKKTFQNEN